MVKIRPWKVIRFTSRIDRDYTVSFHQPLIGRPDSYGKIIRRYRIRLIESENNRLLYTQVTPRTRNCSNFSIPIIIV